MSLPASHLPRSAEAVLELAARTMFDTLAQAAQGMLVVDRRHRIVWISEGYKRFLPALGFEREDQFVGKRVEDVVPNTLLAQVIDTGQPLLLDLLTNKAGTFLVSRLPLRDELGQVIGALGLVLLDHPETTMQPLMTKFSRLTEELADARRQLAAEQGRRRRAKHTIASYVGASPAVLELKRLARRAAASDATVLLLGETGTGKELLAQAIHNAGPRVARPFVGVNIAAVPDTLLEAEFFGVAPGAYTGAERKGRPGKFQLAEGGTLFLDEIGDMPLPLQAKLLRVLQEQEVEPLGSNTVVPLDVRVIAATSRDLPAMVAAGQFRADLYYRLHVLPIRVPALRERLDDLDALAEHLLDDIARRDGLPPRSLAADALDWLARHDWPGNIRELRNLLEQASLVSDERLLGARHLRPLLAIDESRPLPTVRRPDTAPEGLTLPAAVAALEQRLITEALQATGGNKLAAARRLGIARATLYEKLAHLNLPPTRSPS
ncbi:sigma 54-interacting transcriptional regulator [Ideonella sp. 4Y11]|uniref:Sigma 54-interacting transcriptional regulator n=1 Tax=Ideonella aquatica TaxID=2824119 RepID=A0A940YIH0_9BURK|nr:sigma 54-interacting transcriptional regulator [Ideonella aquatica]MBQ0960069.1 sigma 54-interacting transcriptional regulator [Ideonella aquatica]